MIVNRERETGRGAKVEKYRRGRKEIRGTGYAPRRDVHPIEEERRSESDPRLREREGVLHGQTLKGEVNVKERLRDYGYQN